MRTAILCSDDAHHRYLVARLCECHIVTLVVTEPGNAQRQRLWRRHRWADYRASLYHSMRRRIFGLHRYRQRFFVSTESDRRPEREIVVDNINAAEVAAALENTRPDVTIVMGTSIIGKRVLKAAGGTVINIHGGFLPDYRGNNCFFWAMYEEAWDKIGSTLHLVEEEVDAGDIIAVIQWTVHPRDTPERLYCRMEKMAIEYLLRLLDDLDHGIALPHRSQPSGGRVFRNRDRGLRHEIVFWFRYLQRNVWWIVKFLSTSGKITPNTQQKGTRS